nr:MAG TPA_asm: terminase small subunit [Caudoviricetes sp.]
MENELFQSCQTRKITVKKPVKVKTVKVDGKKRLEEERIEYAEEEVVVPANTTAQIFYLKNRKPDKWKDKPVESAAEAQKTEMQTLADLLQRPVPNRDIKDFEE